MTKIRAAFFSDTHLGYDYPLKPRSNRKRRGDDFFANLRLIVDAILKYKPDFVIHGGDVFDHPYIHKSVIDKAFLTLFEIADAGIPLFIVPGNHERGNLPTSLFMQHPNIHIFDTAKTYRIQCQGRSVSVSGFPYYYEGIRKDFKQIQAGLMQYLSPNDLNILCMHQIVEGSKVKNYTFKSNPDVIRIDELSNAFTCILSGHIHRYQLLHSPENNVPVLYPGSTERTSYQEAEETKGWCQLSFEQSENRYTFDHAFIPLPTRPLETLRFENRLYSEDEIRTLILEKVKTIAPDAVLRFQSEFPETIYKISTKMVNEIIPNSISLHRGYAGRKSKSRNGGNG
jgi:DNA repair exonuclease SbcCD nuclease subunit